MNKLNKTIIGISMLFIGCLFLCRVSAPVPVSSSGNSINLLQAVADGNINEVKQFIEKGADVDEIGVTGVYSVTPLLLAVEGSMNEIINELLVNEADPNLEVNGKTALLVAVVNNNSEIVKLLLDYGANPYIKTSEGISAYMLAEHLGNPDIESLICKKVNALDYFPIYGDILWEYVDSAGKLVLRECITSEVETLDNGINIFTKVFVYYVPDANELKEIAKGAKLYTILNGDIAEIAGSSSVKGDIQYDSPHIILKNKVSIGDTWNYTDRGETVKQQVLGFSNVETTFKTFDNCLEVRKTVISSGEILESKLYYAPGIGLIKEVFEDGSTMELQRLESKSLTKGEV